MRLRTCAALLIAALSGAMWFAALDAILLFRAMSDPASAGLLAANGFVASYWIGAVFFLVGLMLSRRSRPIAAVLLVIAGLMLFWIVPALRTHGARWPGSFATLHGSASVGHLLLCFGTAYWSFRLVSAEAMPPHP